MLRRVSVFAILFSAWWLESCDVLQRAANEAMREPTSAEVSQGLKEALNRGVSNGVNTLSARDGYFKSPYKILLPAEARNLTDRLRNVPGFSNLENELLERINRGAEEAAKEAGPIFLAAIRAMTFQDAFNILMGPDNAATDYLRRTTYQQLYDKFNPVIVRALDNIGANKLWYDATTAYNKIPLVTKINTDLDDYVTHEALKGLFAKIEEEEKNIRRNPLARTTALLQKVFARQDRNRQ
ncbi:MAG: DUF4197 domain-containing protein [Saprospiraceae bacterium]|nr:DUF4197 domain-containing protein [Saprospiraceae bacterium]MDW8484728.1 DUF4197 domain-containing protein [Saprospiraceae bacterium]